MSNKTYIIGAFYFELGVGQDGLAVPVLFTENETNVEKLFPGTTNSHRHVKDAFHEYVINGTSYDWVDVSN